MAVPYSSMPSIYEPLPTHMTQEEFQRWLGSPWLEARSLRVRLFGKIRVRVPVERQVPNEADL